MPATVAQKLMSSRKRLYAFIEPGHIVCQRTIDLRRLDDDSADRREHVLHSVVKLSIQRALVLLGMFAVSDINVDANHALRAAIVAV